MHQKSLRFFSVIIALLAMAILIRIVPEWTGVKASYSATSPSVEITKCTMSHYLDEKGGADVVLLGIGLYPDPSWSH